MCRSPKQPRDVIIDEAMTWLGTPWHHAARVKGVGVDCVNFLIAVYSTAGLIEPFTLAPYPRDWNLHREKPLFVEGLLKYADPITDPLPGDVAMFNFGRHAAHGAIVMSNDRVVHAYLDNRQVVISEVANGPLETRLSGYYRLRGM